MLEFLDVRTMLLLGALANLVLAGIMVYYSMARRAYPGFHHWTGGVVSAGMGGVLVSLRGLLPDFVTIIAANFLLVLWPLLLTKGLVIFTGAKCRARVVNLLVLAAFTLTFLWATYVETNLCLRIVCLCSVVAIFFVQALYVAVRHLPAVLGEPDLLLITSLLFSIFGLMFRIAVVLSHDGVVLFITNHEVLQNVAILVSILSAVAVTCSFLILNMHRMEKDLSAANIRIEALANMDGLTSIFNRRYFDAMLNLEYKRMLRNRQPLSLIMADIDSFKAYNDTHGHQAGDECLKAVAAVFRKAGGRGADVAARYGGEEFVMLLPNTDAHGAAAVAGSIRNAVDALAIPHRTSTASAFVTLSIGVATAAAGGLASPDELVLLADQAMYRSKAKGKNRIEVAGPVAGDGIS
jgi:diguanylate cyclase (GGDEF)-like protein